MILRGLVWPSCSLFDSDLRGQRESEKLDRDTLETELSGSKKEKADLISQSKMVCMVRPHLIQNNSRCLIGWLQLHQQKQQLQDELSAARRDIQHQMEMAARAVKEKEDLAR